MGGRAQSVIKLGELMMILDLHRHGLSVSAIARQCNLDCKTVRRSIARGLEPPAYGPRQPRPALLDPFTGYLRERVTAYPGLSGARMHFIEIVVLRSLTATPMFVLGFDQSVLQAYIMIVYVYSALIHANIKLPVSFAFLEKALVSPRVHHWHHGVEKEAIDVNFAIHFPILDKLFGTYHRPENRWPAGYGIEGNPVPQGYVKQFLYPFRRP